MAPRQCGQESPMHDHIVVAGQGSESEVDAQASPTEAKGSSQHQLIGNASFRPSRLLKGLIADGADEKASKGSVKKPSKPVGLHAPQQEPNEQEPELQKSNVGVDISGKGRKKVRTASDKQSPSKKPSTAKIKRVFCDECKKRKEEPGEDGRRQNAKYRCEKCAELSRMAAELAERELAERPRGRRRTTSPAQPLLEDTTAAGQQRHISHKQNIRGASKPASGKPIKCAAPRKPHHEVVWSSDPGTESNDPDKPLIPNTRNRRVDCFGVKRDLSKPTPQISKSRQQFMNEPWPKGIIPKPNFYDDHGQPIYLNDAAVPPRQPLPSLPDAGPAQSYPSNTVNPALLTVNPSSVAQERSHVSVYPNPNPFGTPRSSDWYRDHPAQRAAIEIARMTGGPMRSPSPESEFSSGPYIGGADMSSIFNAFQAAPSNSSNIRSVADPPPAYSFHNPHHPGPEPSPVDPRFIGEEHGGLLINPALTANLPRPGLRPSSSMPMLTGEPTRSSAAQASTNSGPGQTSSHNNHSNSDGIDEESRAAEDMFNQYINLTPRSEPQERE